LKRFGEWIVSEGRKSINEDMSPSEQVDIFEKLLMKNLDRFCPEKSMKLSSQDQPFITKELKTLDRQKSREYVKRGKTVKYQNLAKQFRAKYKVELEKYLRKNMDTLMESKPGQAYKVLKKMGAQPGDCIDENTFTLPSHENENLTAQQSAERIATYFSAISQEYPPLDISSLPACVSLGYLEICHTQSLRILPLNWQHLSVK
jgi:hypothetical protein